MSVVVAIKDNDRVWVGCDSQVTRGYSKYTLSNKNNLKIFKPAKESDVLIGVVGTLKDTNVLSCVEEYIEEITKLKNEFDCKYVITKVVPKLFSELDKYKLVINKENETPHVKSRFLFAYKNNLFSIDSYGSVIEINDYIAIGSGDELALGYLNQCEEVDIKQKVIKAIKASCKTNLYVDYPIVVMNTKDDEIDIIDK